MEAAQTSTMNPYAEHNVIRAPSLKRGKNDEGLNNRVSTSVSAKFVVNFEDLMVNIINKKLSFVVMYLRSPAT